MNKTLMKYTRFILLAYSALYIAFVLYIALGVRLVEPKRKSEIPALSVSTLSRVELLLKDRLVKQSTGSADFSKVIFGKAEPFSSR